MQQNPSGVPTDSSLVAENTPNYLRAFLFGAGVASLCMPAYRLSVAATYSDGTYSEYFIIPIMVGVAVGAAVRSGSEARGNILLGVQAAILTLISMAGNEFLGFHFLINQFRLEEGLDKFPLLLPPFMMILMISDSLTTNPLRILLWLGGLVGAVVVASRREQSPTLGQAVSESFTNIVPASVLSGSVSIPTGSASANVATQTFGLTTRRMMTTAAICMAFGMAAMIFTVLVVNADLVLGVISLGFFGFGFAKMVATRLNADNHIRLSSEGLSVREGDRERLFPWGEIERVWQYKMRYIVYFVPVVNIHNYTIERSDGEKVTIRRRYDGMEELGNTLHEVVTRHQLPKAVETLRNGGALDFGTCSLDRDGLTIKKHKVAWSEIRDVTTAQGQIQIRIKGRFMPRSFYMQKMHNPNLFFILIHQAISR